MVEIKREQERTGRSDANAEAKTGAMNARGCGRCNAT
jgi:hypothetical protein